ncbi:MAG: hypothetical protein SCALA702_20620 [Melioribacteraceae bacterium]|nr:MAG: hypothetical protein SCALA702_20620 [Melioribacteraceae bacterium]
MKKPKFSLLKAKKAVAISSKIEGHKDTSDKDKIIKSSGNK